MTISRHAGGERLDRHRHREGYVALVLAGGYVEAGDGGRLRVGAGDVVIHEAYAAHQDGFDAAGAMVLNLPLVEGLEAGAAHIADPDAVARLAERDPVVAAALLATMLQPGGERLADWPDLLAAALDADPGLSISHWCDGIGINPASASRGFARAYGVSPKRYRLEARTRRALRALPGWRGGIAALAAEHGFADQAHLTRAIAGITGAPPGALREKSVQAGACTGC